MAVDDRTFLLRIGPPARLRWPLVALAGAALVLLAASLTTMRPGKGVAPVPDRTVELTAAVPAELTLTTERPHLSRLRVWVTQPVPADGRVSVALSDAALPLLALARAEVPLSAAGTDGALDLSFEPLRVGSSPHVPTTTLMVRLSFDGDAGASLALRAGAEGQVAFEPGYETRPFDTVWQISALAQGHSGILGWPPFYALLAYAFLVALLRVALLVMRLGEPLR